MPTIRKALVSDRADKGSERRKGYPPEQERTKEQLLDQLADFLFQPEDEEVDSEALAAYAVELGGRMAELEAEIRLLADEPALNVNSSRQLGELLFAKMRIDEKPKMTRTKQFCTDEEYLQGFARKHRIVGLILEYRGVKKLLSTYAEALPQLVDRKSVV